MILSLDDNSIKGSMVGALRKAGHRVVLPADVGLAGVSDPRHLGHCATQGFVLLTQDHEDLLDLPVLVQSVHGQHAGILVVRTDNDPGRDMKDHDVVRAIAHLEAITVPIANEHHILNHWR